MKYLYLVWASLLPFALTAQTQPTALSPADSLKQLRQQKNLSVMPVTVSFTLDKGQSGTAKVNVINNLDSQQQFSVYFGDWERDSIGKHVYSPAGQGKHSCSSWLSVDKSFLEVPAHSTGSVTITLKVPDSVAAADMMKWSMLFFETIAERMPPRKSGKVETVVQRSFRIGVHVYQTPPAVVNKEVKILSFRQLESDKSYRIVCENTGAVQLRCKASLDIQSLETGAKLSLESKEVPLFPEQKRFIDFTLPDTLAKGKYTIVAMVDPGDDDATLEAAEKEIEIR